MATKKVSYIDMDLNWLEGKAEELRAYCDAKPIVKIKDRFAEGKLTANVEAQIKSIRETLQDYIKIITAIQQLKEKESVQKSLVRGDQELSPLESGEI
jgi:hypothetical protein